MSRRGAACAPRSSTVPGHGAKEEQRHGKATAKAFPKGNTTIQPNMKWPNWSSSGCLSLFSNSFIIVNVQSQLILAAISDPQANLNELIDEAIALMSNGVSFGSRESLKKWANGKGNEIKYSNADR